MSLFAALIVFAATLVVVGFSVRIVKNWADQRPVGRAPLVLAVAIAAGLVVQLPLEGGPDWRNVPMAFAQVLGVFRN